MRPITRRNAKGARWAQELIDRAKPPVTVLLINAEAIIDMDAYAVETLAGLRDSLNRQGIGFGICGANGHFLEVLQRARSDEGLKLMVYQSVAVAIKQMAKKRNSFATAEKIGNSGGNWPQ